ncbi:MAG: histidine phosphatase family protein [Clostridia bacterium]|nr:histidine phosphatase family protein [Clostridia bacterium]
MLLFIVRHGDPIYDPDSLTPKGHEQAEALVRRFSVNGLDRIYSSPMVRAQQTAAPTAKALGLTVQIEEWTSENLAGRDLFYTDSQGRRMWYFQADPGEIGEAGLDRFPSEEERYAQGLKRIADASDEFLSRHGYVREGKLYRIERANEERIAVFCHGGFGLTWLSHLLGFPAQHFGMTHDMTHSGVTLLEFANHPSGWTIPRMLIENDMSHILAAGLPFEYNNNQKI